MTTIEHPGWKEFPLASSQPVRASQINALWWALNERSNATTAEDIIETNFPEIEKGRNTQEAAADSLVASEALLAAAETLLENATTPSETTAAQNLIDDANDAIDSAQDDVDEASELSESEIDDENQIIEDQFKTDKMNIFRGAGEDVISINDLTILRLVTLNTLSRFINPEQVDLDDDGEIDFTFRSWSLSTILKKIKKESETIVEEGGVPLSFGGPIDPDAPFEDLTEEEFATLTEEEFSELEEDQIFAWTTIPDRPDDKVIIGPGPVGEAMDQEIDFNVLFGPTEFAEDIVSRTPMFRDHFNEIYEVIKCLTHIGMDSNLNAGNEKDIVKGSLFEQTDFDFSEFEEWLSELESDRADLISIIGSGGEEDTGVISGASVSFGNSVQEDVDRLTSFWRHNISYNISNDLRIGEISITGEFAPTPFEYGENLVAVSYSTLDFTQSLSATEDQDGGGNPSNNEVILKIVQFTDESGEGVDDFGDEDTLQSVQAGERIYDAPIEGGHPDVSGPDIVTDAFFSIPNNLIPTGELIPDTEPKEFKNEFGLNMYAGEEFSTDFSDILEPRDVSDVQVIIAAHGGTFIDFRGFVEVINWVHIEREKEAQRANEASELAVFMEA